MLLPATATVGADSSPALVARRFDIRGTHPNALPRLASQLALGSRCHLRAGIPLCCSNSTVFSCRLAPRQLRRLRARDVRASRRYSFPSARSRRFLVAKAFGGWGAPLKPSGRSSSHRAQAQSCYHPSEDIEDGRSGLGKGEGEGGEDRRLTHAEIARTIVKVNDNLTLVHVASGEDELKDTRPKVAYITDELGGIYIDVDNEGSALQSLMSYDNLVEVSIGAQKKEVVILVGDIKRIAHIEMASTLNTHAGIEQFMNGELGNDDEFEEEDSDFDDEDEDGYEDEDEDEDDDEDDDDEEDEDEYEDEDEDEEDEDDDDDSDEDDDDLFTEAYADWTNQETMGSSHPVYFANKIAEVVSKTEFDWMDRPTCVFIQGFLRPAFVEDQGIDYHQSEKKIPGGPNSSDGHDKRVTFYKVEAVSLHLVTANGHEISSVKVEDYQQAQPDVIAHSAAKIISRLKSGGEKTTQALKSLCLRCKGIEVEEVVLIGVDSLGFDLRACSETQIKNLRFSFKTRATSEYSAERQLNDLLFPRVQTRTQMKGQAPHKE